MNNIYHNIVLNDIQLHVIKHRKPVPWYRAIMKSIRNKRPGRFYIRQPIRVNDDGTFELFIPFTPEMRREKERAERAGKKVRIILPSGGLPIYLGKDAIEFLRAHPELTSSIKKPKP